MKKVTLVLVILTIIGLNSPLALATTSRSTPRSYSSPRTYNSRPQAPRSTPSATRVGTGQLHSRTPAPQPHTFNGKKYNSSTAKYTNTSGTWVFYWLFVANATTGKNDIHCFDKDHKRTTCKRDDKSYQKDW